MCLVSSVISLTPTHSWASASLVLIISTLLLPNLPTRCPPSLQVYCPFRLILTDLKPKLFMDCSQILWACPCSSVEKNYKSTPHQRCLQFTALSWVKKTRGVRFSLIIFTCRRSSSCGSSCMHINFSFQISRESFPWSILDLECFCSRQLCRCEKLDKFYVWKELSNILAIPHLQCVDYKCPDDPTWTWNVLLF